MDLFNKSGVLVAAVLVTVGAAISWQAQETPIPAATVIEAMATKIGARGHVAAERRLQEWAELGSPVAQRELALRYLSNPEKRDEALALFERAASGGDLRAAGLVGMARSGADLRAMARDGLPGESTGAANVARTAGRVLKDAAGSAYVPH
jgi:hypothetical protein